MLSSRRSVRLSSFLGLRGVEAVWEAVKRLDGRISVQQVAFPQYGILSTPGTAELMEQARAEGVEVVGGIDPAGLDGDPVRHLDIVFGLASAGAPVDIHLHDAGSLGVWQLELICSRTRSTGLEGRVTVSHAYGLGQASLSEQDRHLAYRNTFRRDDDITLALDAVTHGGATALALPSYGLVAGALADLVVLPATTPAEAVITHPPRTLVVKSGRRVVQ